jgi:Cu(I)/Ag(I) efflux system membrane protein CusA/SilA
MTIDRLRADMSQAAQLPGVSIIWTMPIINRIDMLTTGIRSEVGVKVGNDLTVLESSARRIADVVRRVPGASNVYPEQVTSGRYLNIVVDRCGGAVRHPCRRYSANHRTCGGETVLTTTVEGRRRFLVRVRLRAAVRCRSGGARPGPGGRLERCADPVEPGRPHRACARAAMISSENGLLIATVLMNVQGRDVGGFVEEARRIVERDVALPAGYYVGWSGRWENQEHARQRLQVVVPIVLVIIFVLLYFTYHSVAEAAHVLLAVPFALTGGVYLLWLLGYNFSVAVWVGFIALFGTAVQTGVVMVIYLEEAVARRREAMGGELTRSALREAVIDGALLRLRPKVMTVSTVIAGLLPIMWSTRVGAEVMKPLATPVLGGMLSSLLHVLIVTPVLFYWLQERRLGLQPERVTREARPVLTKRRLVVGVGAIALIVTAVALTQTWRAHRAVDRPVGAPVQQIRSGRSDHRAAVTDGHAAYGTECLHV